MSDYNSDSQYDEDAYHSHRRITLERSFSRNVLIKVLDEFNTHPIATLFWNMNDKDTKPPETTNPVNISATASSSTNYNVPQTPPDIPLEPENADVLDFMTIRQRLCDGKYETVDSWYEDVLSVFANYNLVYEDPLYLNITETCKSLFVKIAIRNGVELINEWSDRIYKMRARLNNLMGIVPVSMQGKNVMKTRRPKSTFTDKIRKVELIVNALNSFRSTKDWTQTIVILAKNKIEVGRKKRTEIDVMELKPEVINEIYTDLVDRKVIVENEDEDEEEEAEQDPGQDQE